MFCPESFYFTEKILRDSSIHISKIIIELRPIDKLDRVTTRCLYWLSCKEIMFLFGCLWSDFLSPMEKLEYLKTYISSILRKYLGLGIGLNYFSSVFTEKSSRTSGDSGESLDWISLNQRAKDDPLVRKKNAVFRQSPSDFLSKLEDYKKKYPDLRFYNAKYYSRLMALIHLAEKRNVNIFFLLQPLDDNSRILNAAKKIGGKHLIDLSFHMPSYDRTNYFDEVHYNENGARFFTSDLAAAFLKLQKSQSSF